MRAQMKRSNNNEIKNGQQPQSESQSQCRHGTAQHSTAASTSTATVTHCERCKDKKEAANALISPRNSRLSVSVRSIWRTEMNKCNRIGLSCQTNVYIWHFDVLILCAHTEHTKHSAQSTQKGSKHPEIALNTEWPAVFHISIFTLSHISGYHLLVLEFLPLLQSFIKI